MSRTTATSCSETCRANYIFRIISNSAFITSTADCSYIKKLKANKVTLWTKWSVFIVAAVPTAKAIVNAFQTVRSVETKYLESVLLVIIASLVFFKSYIVFWVRFIRRHVCRLFVLIIAFKTVEYIMFRTNKQSLEKDL